MKVIVNEVEGKLQKTIQWESLEDFNKFIHDIESVQRDSLVWPSRPLEMPISYLTVDITRQAGPTKVIEETIPKAE